MLMLGDSSDGAHFLGSLVGGMSTADDTEDTEEQPDYTVAAVGSSRGRGGQRPQSGNSSSPQEPSQTQQAKQAGLCRNHFIYGEKTYNCGGNCSWLGN